MTMQPRALRPPGLGRGLAGKDAFRAGDRSSDGNVGRHYYDSPDRRRKIPSAPVVSIGLRAPAPGR